MFLAKRLIDSTITVSPQQRAQFSDAVENDLDSLYSVDLVFVSEHTDAALFQNIEKNGICLLDRYNTKFENITNACMKACRRIKRILPKSFAMV